jgi:GT2 family glycosyltransferase
VRAESKSMICSVTGDDRLRGATAVVVNWNSHELTVRCAESLLADGLAPERLVLVDNGSANESAAILRERFPSSPQVAIAENIGYARAANRGAAEQEAAQYLFVNNDAFVHGAGSLRLLIEALERDEVGIAVPRLFNPDLTLQKNAVPLPTPLAALSLALGVSRFLPNRYRPLWSTHWDHASSRVIRASIAAVIAVRGEVWRSLGGWAEADSMYGEDIDLSWRALEAGWVTWFEHDATFVHLGNSSGLEDVERARLTSSATRNVIERQLSGPRATAALTTFSLGHLLRAGVFRLAGRRTAASCSLAAAKATWPLGRPD